MGSLRAVLHGFLNQAQDLEVLKVVGQPQEFVSDEQRIQLEKLIVEKGVDLEKFLGYMGVEDVETILKPDFGKALNALKKAKGKNDNS